MILVIEATEGNKIIEVKEVVLLTEAGEMIKSILTKN